MTDAGEVPIDHLQSLVADELTLEEVRAAVNGLDPADPDWADLQWHLADTVHDRFLMHGDPDDLAEAIRRGKLVVAAQDEGSPTHLHDLALMLWDRIEPGNSIDDLGEYQRLLVRALTLLGDVGNDAELEAKCRANLASGLMSSHRYEPSDQERERALALWVAALSSGLLEDDVQAGIAANLAQALSRPEATEDDLRQAVTYGRRAVSQPASDPEEAAHNDFALAAALGSLHSIVEDEGLIEEAIGLVRTGLAYLGSDHPDTPGYTANLIGLLRQQTRETDDDAPLDEAVVLARQAMVQTTDADPDRVLVLTNAGAVLSEAASRHDDAALLNEALDTYRRAVDLAGGSSHEQGVALINLASTCRDANERLDAPGLVEEGIAAGRRSMAIFASSGLHRAAALTATSNTLRDRFALSGSLADLDEALDYAKDALDQTPGNHPERAARLTNLAVLLSDDFTERADRAQLDRAIALYRDALEAAERVGARVPERMNDLALALRDRHKDAGNRVDLDEAVQLAEASVGASRPGRLTWAGYVNNLGNALAERHELEGDVADLDLAVELFQKALDDAEGRIHESSGYASNVGLAFATRARLTGSMADMDHALLRLGRSVDLLPLDHSDRAHRLSNLADAYRQRSIMFDTAGHAEPARADSISAVEVAQEAVRLAGSSDARLLPALSNLAQALRWRRDLEPASVPVLDILDIQRRAATLTAITPAEKFGQAGRWARDAEAAGATEEALHAYAQAIALTTEVAWIGLSVGERLSLLAEMSDVLSRAVAFAAGAQQPWTAVAWADHVRSVLWRQGLHATALSRRRNEEQLAELSGLRPPQLPGEQSPNGPQREQLRHLAHTEREALRMQVASPSDYASLELPGVVVLLVPCPDESFALVLRNGRAPVTVSLPQASQHEVTAHFEALREATTTFGQADDGDASRELKARHGLFDCLDWLWDAVAAPVLSEVGTQPGLRPHLWWSPVGDFALLPVHAAGRHPRKAGQIREQAVTSTAATVQDLVKSSYLPTILSARPNRSAVPSNPGHLLYVSTDEPGGGLAHLTHERAAVRSELRKVEVVELLDQSATISALRAAAPACSYLHIAGHGAATGRGSFEAGFRLADGLFTLRDLAGCDVASGALAVLLTCDSATGDAQSPNEALHAAGSAHQAGFTHVVAATLPLRDSSSVAVVTALYRSLNADPAAVADAIPAALDDAVQALRLNVTTGADPLSWVPYAHFSAGLARSNHAAPQSE